MFGAEKVDRLTEELRRLNDHADWFRKYAEKHELGEAFNDGVDHLGVLAQIFMKVDKVSGGVGVVNSLVTGFSKFKDIMDQLRGESRREKRGT